MSITETFEELYKEAAKRATGTDKINYDPSQLDCIFNPGCHQPQWKLSDILNDDDTTVTKGNPISRDVAGMLHAISNRGMKRAFVLTAPAFQGQFSSEVTAGMMRSAFYEIGFDGFVEVAIFADILTLMEALEFDKNIQKKQDYMITSCCCPMWIGMIKKIYTDLIPHVPPTVSPMIAAGRVIKKLHPDCLTVFIGPCLAKKSEKNDPDIAGAIDFVLTFQETKELFDILNVDLTKQPDKVKENTSKMGRIYARRGGVSEAVRTTLAKLHPHRQIELKSQQADGVPNCRKMIEDIQKGNTDANFFEGMGCIGGCVGGPRSILPKEKGAQEVDDYGDKALYETPLDNPYVLELLHRLNFTTLDSLLEDKELFVRKW